MTDPGQDQASRRSGSHVLTINGGSSSLKFALYDQVDAEPRKVGGGKVERVGLADPKLVVADGSGGHRQERPVTAATVDQVAEPVLAWVADRVGLDQVRAVGHRVVHGGSIDEPTRVTPDLVQQLRAFESLDPDHVPAELALIERFAERLPGVPQVVCFDTTFHRDLPRVARIVPVPRRFEALGVRRYGFHGLSYTFLLEELRRVAGPSVADGRVILAHLGSGASLAAVRGGQCIDTTMGFSPASGVVMGTRPGDLDPGLAPFLSRVAGVSPEDFGRMVHNDSGLKGVSETSSDLRDLLAAEGSDVRAAEAVELFCYRVRAAIGSLAATLGGLETLVFSGGIGEQSAEARRRILVGLDFLGVSLDPDRNNANAAVISTEAGGVAVRVIPTDEERVIVRQVIATLAVR